MARIIGDDILEYSVFGKAVAIASLMLISSSAQIIIANPVPSNRIGYALNWTDVFI